MRPEKHVFPRATPLPAHPPHPGQVDVESRVADIGRDAVRIADRGPCVQSESIYSEGLSGDWALPT